MSDFYSTEARENTLKALDDAAELRSPDLVVGLQRERVPIMTYADAYYWSCRVCGWLGTGLGSIDSAQAEGATHWRGEHAREFDIEAQP